MESWEKGILITDRPPRTVVLKDYNNTKFIIVIYQNKIHILASEERLEKVKEKYQTWHHGHGMLVHHVPRDVKALVRELQNIN